MSRKFEIKLKTELCKLYGTALNEHIRGVHILLVASVSNLVKSISKNF